MTLLVKVTRVQEKVDGVWLGIGCFLFRRGVVGFGFVGQRVLLVGDDF